MTPPLTPRPNCPQESVAANGSTSTQIFGVMYITLTGLIYFMVPASRPWALLGKLLSYIVKLAPILWWALPAGPTGRPPESSQEPPTGWIPDTIAGLYMITLSRLRKTHSSKPYSVLKAAFGMSSGLMQVWQYPAVESNFIKSWDPQGIKKVISQGQVIPVLNCDLVERFVVGDQAESSIFLCYKKRQPYQKEIWMLV
ncbi:hypothetical protein DSO57_1035232 [Entomophthora muscae]|uniref:Uncharacterized protein n=1 Tax=Entomophthora muscae TaxID=34485 RepID=A0ACC2SPD4_9FUNG|nr:hypothetical protein DSO57_1035232 [Entomophthora muscae]